ncbi:hypothetical protein V5799_032450 [Amblyomma americanum]|uniref:Uncharacterized protein n=1 Tax=Amblyomma americanum TaxID=6943 RepID=A0AAQ4DR52_AMBAM
MDSSLMHAVWSHCRPSSKKRRLRVLARRSLVDAYVFASCAPELMQFRVMPISQTASKSPALQNPPRLQRVAIPVALLGLLSL